MDPGSKSPRWLADVRDDVCSALPANVFMRHSWFDPESRLGGIAYKPPLTPKPRHSGLDPESSPYPFMDPESKSPRELSNVRDDVCSALPANVFTRHSWFDPESRPGVIAYKPPPDPKPTSFRA